MKSKTHDLFRTLKLTALICALAGALPAAQGDQGGVHRKIDFPDIPGYRTLKCDFHIHTIFSDGKVWPNIRVDEGVLDGLDVIAITDHLERNPHRVDVPFPDQNRSYEIAQQAAKDQGIVVLSGAEITRLMPPEGAEPRHLNAIFLKDANRLKQKDAVEVLREAAKQGAFVIWNHPSWLRQTPDGVARLTELHEQLLKENLFQGIEVVNESTYSDEALEIALDRNLAIIGDTDIHAPIERFYPGPAGQHRPTTFVFAHENSEDAIKEALLDRRTAVWFRNTLIGRKEWLEPLLAASITATGQGYEWEDSNLSYQPKTSALNMDLKNSTDADFILRNVSHYRFYDHADVLILPAHSTTRIMVKTPQRLPEASVQFEVMNAVIAPGAHPVITFNVKTGMRRQYPPRQK